MKMEPIRLLYPVSMLKSIFSEVPKGAASIFILVFGCCCFAQQPDSTLDKHQLSGSAQGTTYTVTYYHASPIISQTAIDSIFQAIDKSMSLYDTESQIVRFNRKSTSEMVLDPHMTTVMKKAFEVYEKSEGLFDVTVNPLMSLWGFGPEGPNELPDSLAVQDALTRVGMDKISLNGNVLTKNTPGVEVDLNGIAQGYTVDVLYNYLLGQQLEHFIVEVGGEIRASGRKPDGDSFKIWVQRPEGISSQDGFVIELTDQSVTTSGSYEQTREVDGYRFSHLMDPRTGYPLQSSTVSVTVIADQAIDADAYDNVFIAMDPEEAIEFANSENKIDIYLMYLDEGTVKEAYSTGFSKYLLTN